MNRILNRNLPFSLALTALLAAAVLAGCAPTASNQTGEDLATIVKAERARPTPATKCEVPAGLVGKPHTELAKMKFRGPIRVIFPGTAVTGDQVANRLNFKVDRKGIITGITCG